MKAIFCDFYGTAVHENGPNSYEVIKRVYKNSTADSPDAVIAYWWGDFRKRLTVSCGENWKSQHELALESFESLVKHFNSTEDPVLLRDMMNEHWCNPPIYEDTKSFMEHINLPIYFITNSDDKHIISALENHNLTATGIFTNQMAKYSKPHPELFQYALSSTGLTAQDVIHIGDSLSGDVECPTSLGIKALWMNRDNAAVPKGVTAVSNLMEAQEIIASL